MHRMPQCHTTADHIEGGDPIPWQREGGNWFVFFTGEDQEYNDALNFRDGSIWSSNIKTDLSYIYCIYNRGKKKEKEINVHFGPMG